MSSGYHSYLPAVQISCIATSLIEILAVVEV